MALKVIIVGGVAGGATAAARLRRINEDAEIIIVEKGDYISYANCGLPYHIGGVIPETKDLLVQTPESMWKRFRIKVRLRSEVRRIIPERKEVEIFDHAKESRYIERYDKLLLSPGAEPFRPNLPGIHSERIFTLRTIPDTLKIKELVEKQKPERAVVIGAGFIGLEVAENLAATGTRVTIVELADHVIAPLDFDMAALVHQHLKTKGVEFYLKEAVASFSEKQGFLEIRLTDGKTLRADLAVLGVGVKPDVQLAREAGLLLGPRGGIKVDEHLRTSNPDIYAVGDAIEVEDFTSGEAALIPLAGPANKQGRIAANNICGVTESYQGTQGTSIVQVFDITVATTGANEGALKRMGVSYEKSFTHSPSHAGYYPGGTPMAVKLLFSRPDGRVLGAQIIGYDGVDKRIDVISTAMRSRLTVFDLERLELAYAPMYSSAKDPVNIAGYTAANILKGDCPVFHWNEIPQIDSATSVIIDVRTEDEFQQGSIPGAVNIPVDSLRDRLSELSQEKNLYVYCQVGLRGYIALRILKQHGFARVRNLSGGYKTYQLAMQKQSNEDIYENDIILRDDSIQAAS